MLRANRLDVDRALVLVIDVQTKLLPLILGQQRIVAGVLRLLAGARLFELPVLVTEQYPKGIGPTHPGVAEAAHAAHARMLEKPTFSACGEPPVRAALAELDRPQVILVGIEAHVCVLQTALDLRAQDYDVFVCADAVGSRTRLDGDMALERMRQEGIYVTTVESALFELCDRCDAPRFKAMLEIIKAAPPSNDAQTP